MLQICLALSFLSSGYPAVAIGLDAKRAAKTCDYLSALSKCKFPRSRRKLNFSSFAVAVCSLSFTGRVCDSACVQAMGTKFQSVEMLGCRYGT